MSTPRTTRPRRTGGARRAVLAPVAPLVAALLLAGCGGSSDAPAAEASSTPAASGSSSATPSDTASATASGTLTVFAAASLTATFTEIAADFEAANPGVDVALNFAGSSDLVTQITEGAPADVLATADEKNMAKITDADLAAGDPVDVATNTLEIVTAPGNPAGITGFADLADPDLAVVVCAPQVPCGSATEKVEGATGVTLSPVSEESSVTDVLAKVTSGQADAGLVYVTDVTAAGDAVDGVTFPESSGAVNSYPVVALADAQQADLAAQFVDYVAGEDGQRVLAAAGFGPPAAS